MQIVHQDRVKYRKLWSLLVITLLYPLLNFNPQSLFNPDLKVGWLFSLLLTLFTLGLMSYSYGKSWSQRVGLAIKKRYIPVYLCTFACVTCAMFFFIARTSLLGGYSYQPAILFRYYKYSANFTTIPLIQMSLYYLYHVFQTLNDEIIVGALVLFSIRGKLPQVSPLIISLVIGAFFSIGHYVYYLYTPVEQGVVGLLALMTLFFAGFIRNYLILRNGHIIYSWILHLSWNLLFFPGYFIVKGTDNFLERDVVKMNLILGDSFALVTFAAISLALIFFHIFSKKSGFAAGKKTAAGN